MIARKVKVVLVKDCSFANRITGESIISKQLVCEDKDRLYLVNSKKDHQIEDHLTIVFDGKRYSILDIT